MWRSGSRSTECDIVLQGGLLSRVHAIIRRTLLPGDSAPTFTLEDRSANGVWFRGKRMPPAQPQTMCAGDEFCLGSASRCVDAAPALELREPREPRQSPGSLGRPADSPG